MSPPWRTIQRQNFTDWKKLFDFLELEEKWSSEIVAHPRFPLNLPKRLAEKIEKNNVRDPILRQFLPLIEENKEVPGFITDPVAEETFRRKRKLLHKYEGRALLVCTSACVMNCRFCFRRNFDYDTEEKLFEQELKTIGEDPSLTEILLSGGDPLSLSDEVLQVLIEKLSGIPHLKRLRFHTRFPIGIPERVTPGFLKILENTRLQTIFVIHTNHPHELDEEVLGALRKIQRLGIPVISQTVLIKGVNDNVQSLKNLFERLVDHGMLPYYLHQLDKVHGAAHFEVSEQEGLKLIEQCSRLLPGYAVPKYVKEIPGLPYKVSI